MFPEYTLTIFKFPTHRNVRIYEMNKLGILYENEASQYS